MQKTTTKANGRGNFLKELVAQAFVHWCMCTRKLTAKHRPQESADPAQQILSWSFPQSESDRGEFSLRFVGLGQHKKHPRI